MVEKYNEREIEYIQRSRQQWTTDDFETLWVMHFVNVSSKLKNTLLILLDVIQLNSVCKAGKPFWIRRSQPLKDEQML